MTKPRRRVTAALAVWAAILSATAASAQTTGAPAAPETDPQLPAAVERALGQVRGGNLAGAIAGLEEVRKSADPPGPALSLLGALYLEANRPADALAVLEPMAAKQDADPAVLFHAGRAALALNRNEQGEAYLSRSLERAPHSEAGRILGLRRARHGQTLSAYKLLLPWTRANPNDVQARVAAAFCAVDLERPAEARELLASLPQDAPHTRLLRGQLLLLEDDVRGALALAEPLLSNHPPELDGDVTKLAADLYLRLGRPADALRLLQGRSDLDVHGTLLLGRARLDRGELAECERLLGPLATAARQGSVGERAGVQAAILTEHGRCAVGLLHWPQAVESLRAAAALSPGEAEIWQLLTTALRASGEHDEAARSSEVVAGLTRRQGTLAPGAGAAPPTAGDAIDASITRAFGLARQGRLAQAVESLETEIELAPAADPRPLIAHGVLLLQAGRTPDALRSAEAAVARAPTYPPALHLRGAVLMATRDFKGAERDLRAALARSPDFAPALGDLGVLLLDRGRPAEALPLFERLATLQPQDEAVRRNLAEARKRAGGG